MPGNSVIICCPDGDARATPLRVWNPRRYRNERDTVGHGDQTWVEDEEPAEFGKVPVSRAAKKLPTRVVNVPHPDAGHWMSGERAWSQWPLPARLCSQLRRCATLIL